MCEWYNLTVKYRGDWGILRQACLTEIILRFARQLVNDSKTNQFPFSTLFKLRSIFYMKITFLGWSISVSIDHVILDFPMILVVSYTCAITLSLMYNGLLQIHPMQKLWIISDMRSVRVLQCSPKRSLGAPSLSQWRCPESVSRCPHFFQAHIVSATSSISQLQALATRIHGICSIQILILAWFQSRWSCDKRMSII